MKVLYTELYGSYGEFREAEMIPEERLENPVLKAKREGRAEVARNLLKAEVSNDVIVRVTGLSIAGIEKQ